MATIVPGKEHTARDSPCTCYKLNKYAENKPENLICFSEGMQGTLSNPQDSEFCTDWNIKYEGGLVDHLRKFSMMGEIMDMCAEKDISYDDFLPCVIERAEEMRGE